MKISNFWYLFCKYAPGVFCALAVFAETVLPAWGCPDNISKAIVVTLGALGALAATIVKLSSGKFWEDKEIVINTEKGE